jgi:hypothetical protein
MLWLGGAAAAQAQEGACCYGGGTTPIQCVVTTMQECVDVFNGDWKGPGTDCADLNGNGVADICEIQELTCCQCMNHNPWQQVCDQGVSEYTCLVEYAPYWDECTYHLDAQCQYEGEVGTCVPVGQFEGDFGDAPEEALAYPATGVIGLFPTCMNVGPLGSYIHHVNLGPYFGPMVDGEMEGNAGLCPLFNPNQYNQDECWQDGDAGLLVPPAYTIRGPVGLEQVFPCAAGAEGPLGPVCQVANWGPNIDIHVVNSPDRESFVNVLIDWDQGGTWGGFSFCPLNPAPEHVLIDFLVPPGFVGPLSALTPPGFLIGPNPGYVWARISITDRPVGMANEWDGSGIFEAGETEDYLLLIEGEQEPRFDYGDAPEDALAYSTGVVGMFPTCINVGPIGSFIQHGLGWARFGQGWDPELDGNGGLCPMFGPYDNDECFQDGDAGLIMPEPFTLQGGVEVPCPGSAGTPLGLVCQPAFWGGNIDIIVINNMPVEGFVNVLMDWNQDGMWGGVSSCPGGTIAPEHVLVDFPVPVGFNGPLSALGPPSFLIGPNSGFVWARFSITERPVGMADDWDGSGIFEDGETEDYLLLIEGEQEPRFDYGDAPEDALAYSTGVVGMFPTCINVGPIGSFIQHGLGWARFGQGWDPELDGNGGLCPMFGPYDNDECFQDGDAGLIMPEPFTLQGGVEVPCPGSAGTPLGLVCQPAFWGGNIDIIVINNMPVDGFVNVLMDWNQDGMWGGASPCPTALAPEHVLVDFVVPVGFSGPLSALGPPSFLIGPNSGFVWARFSITERPVGMADDWDGSGIFEDGETEDYLLLIEGEQEPRFDYGDAPEDALAYSTGVVGMFPTCINVGPIGSFIQHGLGWARFGQGWDPELDGNGGLCPMFGPYDNDECFQDGDAGLIMPEPFTLQGGVEVPCPGSAGTPLGLVCQPAFWGGNVDIFVTNNMPSQSPAYVNVLIDWDQNGMWGGTSTCPDGTVTMEHVLVDFVVPPGFSGPLSALGPPSFLIGPNPGFVWARFSITEQPVGSATIWDGSGIFEDGETEDYLLLIEEDTTPPQLTEVKSRKNHGVVLGNLDIVIPLGLQPSNRHIIEFRQHSATMLILSFDEPLLPATVIPANFRVCGLNSTPGSPATATLDGTGQVVTLTYANGAIPNGQLNNSPGDVYVLQVLPGVTDLAGNPIDPSYDRVYFAASFGNVNKATNVTWANVNPADRNEIAINYTNTPTAALALRYDVVILPAAANAGKINPTDANQVALSYSTTALDRLTLPTCP